MFNLCAYKMKNLVMYLLLIIIFIINPLLSEEPPLNFTAYKIFDSDGDETDFYEVAEEALDSDIIFFGELHNNPISHWLQLELLKALHYEAEEDEALVLGMEMFEADDQLILDEFARDKIPKKNFENEAKMWNSYKTDYKPIVEYAVENNIKLAATNIPRRYAARVARAGLESLEGLSEKAKEYFPPLPIEVDLSLGCYKKMESMAGHMPAMKKSNIADDDDESKKEESDLNNEEDNTQPGKTPVHFDHGKIMKMARNFKEAQAVKDAAMAYFIWQNMPLNGRFLHLNGAWHSDNYEGIVWFVRRDMPDRKILTITTIEKEKIDEISDEEAKKADFIIVTPASMIKTH